MGPISDGNSLSNPFINPISKLEHLADGLRGCCFLFNSIAAMAVWLWGCLAGCTELNWRRCPRNLNVRSRSVPILERPIPKGDGVRRALFDDDAICRPFERKSGPTVQSASL